MAVILVCAALDYRYAVGECLVRRDTGEAQAGDSVHVGRQTDRMPMDGRNRLQTVRDRQRDGVASRHRSVGPCTEPFTAVTSRRRPVKFTGKIINGQIEVSSDAGFPRRWDFHTSREKLSLPRQLIPEQSSGGR